MTSPKDWVHICTQGEPALLKSVCSEWPLAKWTPKEFAELETIGEHFSVDVCSNVDGRPRWSKQYMLWSEAIDRVSNSTDQLPIVYLSKIPFQQLGRLGRTVELPHFLNQALTEPPHLWLGRLSRSPLHYDTSDNLLCQVQGRKRVTLFAPSQSRWLYPRYAFPPVSWRDSPTLGFPDTNPTFSAVDPDYADAEHLPQFQHAQASAEFVLEAGDALYIPPYWWHSVCSLPSDSLTVSVNFWCTTVYGQPPADDLAEFFRLQAKLVRQFETSPPMKAAFFEILQTLCHFETGYQEYNTH